MAFNFEKLKLSQKRFLAKSFDKMLNARARNAVIERHLEGRQSRMQYLEDRRLRLERRDRLLLVKHWRISTLQKSPEQGEWLSRQKSQIWREQARDRIKKRGSRPGPIIPAMIFANDGSSHQIFFQNGAIRQKATRTRDKLKEREEFFNILPKISFLAKNNQITGQFSNKDISLPGVNNSDNVSEKNRTLSAVATDICLPDLPGLGNFKSVVFKDKTPEGMPSLEALHISNFPMSASSRSQTDVSTPDSTISTTTECRVSLNPKVTFANPSIER